MKNLLKKPFTIGNLIGVISHLFNLLFIAYIINDSGGFNVWFNKNNLTLIEIWSCILFSFYSLLFLGLIITAIIDYYNDVKSWLYEFWNYPLIK